MDPHIRARIEAGVAAMAFLDLVETIAGTPSDWYDGLDPATAWALQWIGDSCGQTAAVRALGTAARAGYRHGRLLLGIEDHPDYSAAEVLDLAAERLHKATGRLAVSESFDELPAGVFLVNHCLAEGLVGALLLTATPSARTRLLTAFHLVLDQGFALALVESDFAMTQPGLDSYPQG